MTFWIRADGSRAMGLGHIRRCIPIADEARRRSVPVRFVVSEDADLAVRTVEEAALPISRVAAGTLDWIDHLQDGDMVLCDGYHLIDQIEAVTLASGIRVAAFDDFGRDMPPVDVLLMPSLAEDLMARPRRSRVLLGPQFAPVASDFMSFRRVRGRTGESLLVTLGSSDPAGLAPAILRAIASLQQRWRVVLLLGPGMGDMVLAEGDRISATRHEGEVAPFFDRFDAVVAAAGTTTWELLCMGMPTVLIVAADNQRAIAKTAAAAQAALLGGDAGSIEVDLPAALTRLLDEERRIRLSHAALELVDGRGAVRILDALLDQ